MEKGIHLKFKNVQALYFNPVGLRISIKKGKLFPKNLSTFALCLLAKNGAKWLKDGQIKNLRIIMFH